MGQRISGGSGHDGGFRDISTRRAGRPHPGARFAPRREADVDESARSISPDVVKIAVQNDPLRTEEDGKIVAFRDERMGEGAVKTRTPEERAAEAREREKRAEEVRRQTGIKPLK